MRKHTDGGGRRRGRQRRRGSTKQERVIPVHRALRSERRYAEAVVANRRGESGFQDEKGPLDGLAFVFSRRRA